MGLGFRVGWVVAAAISFAQLAQAANPVWRVTNTRGQTLYLAGSIHALRSADYPLPAAFNQAFESSSRLAFEVDQNALKRSSADILRLGKYPAGDNLKKHVDPRTYEYVRRVFALMHVPETKFAEYRPWLLSLMLDSPSVRGLSEDLGVEEFLMRRATTNKKPAVGLETAREHTQVFSGMSDVQAEATLLLTFLPRAAGDISSAQLITAWRRGDIDVLWHAVHDSFRDFPSLGERLLEDRNRAWIPKIEGYFASDQTYMVTVGAAHMGGPQGLHALLKARGYHIDPL
ncbi:MAG: TraB/GumN family protein [Chthoniobacterales bacterium]